MSKKPESLFGILNRREFVRRSGGCAALSSISVLSTLLNLKLTASAVAAGNGGGDYKALVCLFMFGGCDTRNLLAPFNDTEHAGYVDIRQGLHYETENGVALPRAGGDANFGGAGLLDPSDANWGMALKPIRPKASSPNAGRDFGIHGYFNANRNEGTTENPGPQITATEDYMRDLYNSGNMSWVCNVGSLVSPDTNISNWRQFRPVGLFSHSDEQRNWMTAMPEQQSQNIGFLGRTADILTDTANQNSKIAMNIAMDNFNTMMTGELTLPYIINDNVDGAQEFIFNRYPSNNGPAHRDRIISDMTDGLLTDQFANLLELSHSTSRRDAIDAASEFSSAIRGVTLLTDDAGGFGPWPEHGIGRDMRQVARSIIARESLQQERQLFFLSRGGFDNHSNLIGNHNTTLPEIGEAVYRFWKEMEAQGLQDCVTLFSASDFERTYGPNSNKGTDHGWASNQFVVGGSQINGGDILGNQPDSSNPADFRSGGQFSTDSRGRIIPSHSVDEYMSELIKWFGDFTDNDLEMILPNYSKFAGRSPIGHMA